MRLLFRLGLLLFASGAVLLVFFHLKPVESVQAEPGSPVTPGELAAYHDRHYHMERYLFQKTPLFVERGTRLVQSGKTMPQGYHTASERRRFADEEYLFVPAENGWIREVLTSAAPRSDHPAGKALPIGDERVDFWYALPADYEPDDLENIPAAYRRINNPVRLRREALVAFVELCQDARKEGLSIYGFSGFRSFALQRELFLRRIQRGEGIRQKAVARPGHSEHQLGTTIDVVNDDLSLAAQVAFGPTREGRWLRRRCYDFGFVLSYGEDNRVETGYMKESWHLRYIGRARVNAWKKRHLAPDAARP